MIYDGRIIRIVLEENSCHLTQAAVNYDLIFCNRMLGPRSRRWFRIERQLWSDNPLIRSHPLMEQDTGNKQRDWLLKVASQPSSRFLIWHRGKFAVTQSTLNIPSTKSSSIQLTWQNYTFVERLKQSCNIKW